MKLSDIKPLHEAFEQDFSPNTGKRLHNVHFELAYNAVKKEVLTIQDIKELAKIMEQNEAFDRTVGSAIFILTRMHILVHGMAPYGVTEKSAEEFFKSSKPMENFVETKGIDVDKSMLTARAELKTRPVLVNKDVAAQAVWDYYRANKSNLPRNIINHKNNIMALVMQGIKPVEAFARFS
jgi:hypothetical protein